MQISPLTVGPIVGEITPATVRLWGRAEVEKAPSGIRRCFGIVFLKTVPDLFLVLVVGPGHSQKG